MVHFQSQTGSQGQLLDSISYATLLLGVMHAGYVVFPISTRNNAAAVAHLLAQTRAQHIYISSDPAMQALAHEAAVLLEAERGVLVHPLSMPSFEDLYTPFDSSFEPVQLPKTYDRDAPALIFHSSGV